MSLSNQQVFDELGVEFVVFGHQHVERRNSRRRDGAGRLDRGLPRNGED